MLLGGISDFPPKRWLRCSNVLNECGSSHNFIDRALDRHSFGKFEKNLFLRGSLFPAFSSGEGRRQGTGWSCKRLPCARENTRKNTTLLAIVQRLTAINLIAFNVHPVLRIVSIKFRDDPARPRPTPSDLSGSESLRSGACACE